MCTEDKDCKNEETIEILEMHLNGSLQDVLRIIIKTRQIENFRNWYNDAVAEDAKKLDDAERAELYASRFSWLGFPDMDKESNKARLEVLSAMIHGLEGANLNRRLNKEMAKTALRVWPSMQSLPQNLANDAELLRMKIETFAAK